MKAAVPCAFLCTLLVGCGAGSGYSPKKSVPVEVAAVKPGLEDSLLPLKVGNQWVYTVTAGNTSREMTLKVTEVAKRGGATFAKLATSTLGGRSAVSEWKLDASGIYQVSTNGKDKFSPPQLLVPFPLRSSSEVKVDTTGPLPTGRVARQIGSLRVLGTQETDTDIGRFSGFAVLSELTWEDSSSSSVSWWTPGIGFVRQRQEIRGSKGATVILMKLKSYSFP